MGDNGSKDNSSSIYINGTIRKPILTGTMKAKTQPDLVFAENSGNTYVNIQTDKYPDEEVTVTTKDLRFQYHCIARYPVKPVIWPPVNSNLSSDN